MNNKRTFEPLKFIFRQKDYPAEVIEKARNDGIEIHEDKDKIYACACFNNTTDYNAFKENLSALSIGTTA